MSVAEWVRDDFGLDLSSLDEVGHGADDAARLWRAVDAAGARYAVKHTGGGTPAGLVVGAHLAELGIVGVVGPARTRDGRLWSVREGRRLSVAAWISDVRAVTAAMTARQWASFGELLSHVHRTRITDDLAEALPRERHTHERLRPALSALEARLRMPTEDPLALALVDRWRGADGLMWTLMRRADELGKRLRATDLPVVVCHGDPHLGNVLLADHAWLIDWDDAVLAPRERDLMLLLGGMGRFGPAGPRERSWFFDGYGAVELDLDRLTYYRCVRALEDLVDPAAQVLDVWERDGAERAESLAIVRAVLSPDGIARTALRSG